MIKIIGCIRRTSERIDKMRKCYTVLDLEDLLEFEKNNTTRLLKTVGIVKIEIEYFQDEEKDKVEYKIFYNEDEIGLQEVALLMQIN